MSDERQLPEAARGLKVGLEIHQQLDHGKLFCRCPSELVEEEGVTVRRRLRRTAGETGEVDPAASFEASRGLEFSYQAPSASCPVELDEEPPKEIDQGALGTALLIALMLHASIPPEIHFMRKIVIDGSNTTGFQRTALIGMNGMLMVEGREVPIPTVCLEEDAARRIPDAQRAVFRLDRQGIPLVEIATAPVITSPEEAGKVAKALGDLLRATRRVKRGLGTIREDLNISIEGGARVEIKGVQDLGLIPAYVANEAGRQADLTSVRELLASRGASVDGPVEATHMFASTGSAVLKRALTDGGVVLATRMKGFSGVFSERHSCRGKRILGPELADHARIAGLGGLFHSDELPAYGVTREEVESLSSFLSCGPEDGFVMVAGQKGKCEDAIRRIILRANAALAGVPEETREPLPEGDTCFARPLPGGSRMYPETDVPVILVTEALLDSLAHVMPEPLDQMAARLASEYGIHVQQAAQIVREELESVFEASASRDKQRLGPVAARLLLSTAAELEREGVDAGRMKDGAFLAELVGLVADGTVSKEGLASVASYALAKDISPTEAVRELGMATIAEEEVTRELESLVSRNLVLIRQKGRGAIGPLMGDAMKTLGGRADGKLVNKLLSELVSKALKE